MCFDYLPDEQGVFRNEAAVCQAAFKIRIALFDQWGAHLCGRGGREPERFEFVHLRAGAVADADHLVHQIGGWHADHAFLAAADHLEAVVGVGDATGHERWREFQHHVPAHGHDVGVSLPRRAHQPDGTRFQIASDLRHWIIFLSECWHVLHG